jgi:hypothetical protein
MGRHGRGELPVPMAASHSLPRGFPGGQLEQSVHSIIGSAYMQGIRRAGACRESAAMLACDLRAGEDAEAEAPCKAPCDHESTYVARVRRA